MAECVAPLMSGQAVTVLCVDDEEDLVALTASYLERADEAIETITVTDPSQVLDRLDTSSADCVVSDYDMPGMDGIELLDTVRASYPDLPFILFTGKGSEEVASEAIASGVTDYLQKDTGSEQYELLANRARNAVEQYRASQRASSLDRIRTILGDVNQALVRSHDRATIEHHVCEIVAGAEPYRLACIAEPQSAGDSLTIRANAVCDDADLDGEKLLADSAEGAACPVWDALEAGTITTARVDETNQWPATATERGYRAAAALPIVYEGDRYGVLCLYAEAADAFDWRERELLAEIGDDLAHAIYRIELHERQQRYERIISNVPEGVYRNSPLPDGTLIEVNPALVDLFGAADASDLVGRPFEELYADPADREQFIRALEREGIVRDMELRLQRLSGAEFWASVTGIMTEESGERYFDGVVRDVTEQRTRDRELKQYETLFDLAPFGMFRTDTDGEVHKVNEWLASLLGYESPAAAIESGDDLATDVYANPERRETLLDRLVTAGSISEFDIDAYDSDGELIELSVHATVLEDGHPAAFDIIGFVEPIPPSPERSPA
ncbi:response regulator [Halorhabdus sp. CBA1104]|uniref:response regulator n=1 Tax=Halorhabdus sp. CBA1104 TaxID=1380432 RepID=UPI0012B2FB75|nr:response regulator [Halorhabdus sp. CBA1104]QGN07104.1 response regulator [Halorhabdus sp. CBA1104]